jgi:hypothetical protein
VDVIEHDPPTFQVPLDGVMVKFTAPSVVSAVGAEIVIADAAPLVANTCVQLGEPIIAVVLEVAPSVAPTPAVPLM